MNCAPSGKFPHNRHKFKRTQSFLPEDYDLLIIFWLKAQFAAIRELFYKQLCCHAIALSWNEPLSGELRAIATTAVLPSAAEPLTVTVPLMEEMQERYLEIREVKTGAVIMTLEVQSPKNKRAGERRDAYLRRRQQVLASLTHLVEIDLLRAGKPMPIQGNPPNADYRILVSRGDPLRVTRSARCPTAQLYAFSLHDVIPVFPLSLKAGSTEPLVNLNEILNGVYERAGFDLRIDYTQPLQPPLIEEGMAWVDGLLQEAGLRS